MAGTLPGADVINNGALLTHEDRIIAVGSAEEVLAHPSVTNASMLDRIDCKHQLLLPGFIDCHTHLVYAGNRAREFEQRLEGVSYEEIARLGGGIRSTVKDTRKSAQEDLVKGALGRAKRMCSEGVTTIEVKGGYGLTLECEQKMLRVARSLETVLPVSVHTTFLGAHAVPEEFSGRSDDYIDLVCSVMLPEIAKEGLADSVDAFCENIAFSEPQVRTVFKKAHALGLPVRLHADQLSNSQGARLAAEFSALSADHLEYTDEAGVRALKQAGTVAVLLPGAFYFLKEQ
ncbi:MAG TPA: imidazolonepropionase, partial [Gammaproteobacteria bacterium]|nr:imidazolonepropionase [Gammaproteobacteria bacterium]